MSKHLLIVGRSRRLHEEVRAQGHRMTALVPQRQLGSLDHRLYDRVIGMTESATVAEWVELASAIHRFDEIQAIGGFNVQTQPFAVAIAAALGLPFLSDGVVRRTTRKDEMRQVLRAAGIDPTESRCVESPDEMARFADRSGYPVVSKPVDGAGSLAVSVLRGPGDLGAAWARLRRWAPGRTPVVEPFLEGDEYSVEGFSEAGQHRIVAITQKFKDPTTCVETGHCVPAPISDALGARIGAFVAAALTALGVERGPSHTEVMVTRDGPRMIETHTRLGGDNIVDLVRLVTGVNLYELWVRQICGENVLDRVTRPVSGFAAVWFATPQAEGVLERVVGVEEARSLPGVVSVSVLQTSGARMCGPQQSDSRGASAVATAESAEEAVARARAATDRLRFVLSCVG